MFYVRGTGVGCVGGGFRSVCVLCNVHALVRAWQMSGGVSGVGVWRGVAQKRLLCEALSWREGRTRRVCAGPCVYPCPTGGLSACSVPRMGCRPVSTSTRSGEFHPALDVVRQRQRRFENAAWDLSALTAKMNG